MVVEYLTNEKNIPSNDTQQRVCYDFLSLCNKHDGKIACVRLSLMCGWVSSSSSRAPLFGRPVGDLPALEYGPPVSFHVVQEWHQDGRAHQELHQKEEEKNPRKLYIPFSLQQAYCG